MGQFALYLSANCQPRASRVRIKPHGWVLPCRPVLGSVVLRKATCGPSVAAGIKPYKVVGQHNTFCKVQLFAWPNKSSRPASRWPSATCAISASARSGGQKNLRLENSWASILGKCPCMTLASSPMGFWERRVVWDSRSRGDSPVGFVLNHCSDRSGRFHQCV